MMRTMRLPDGGSFDLPMPGSPKRYVENVTEPKHGLRGMSLAGASGVPVPWVAIAVGAGLAGLFTWLLLRDG